MTRLRGTSAAAAAILLLFVSACANAGGAASGSTGSGKPGAGTPEPGPVGEAPVLRVTQVGGFAAPSATLSRIPMISVYDDGRVITEGPQILIFPAPALPSVQVTTITAEAVRTLVKKATEAGVQNNANLGRPSVADAPSTRITVVTDAGTQTVEAEALHEAMPNDPALNGGQRAARQKLRTFLEQLTDLEGTLGAGQVKGTAPYTPAAIAAIATPWKAVDEPGISAPPAREWPGPALPGESAGAGTEVGCATVHGDAVAAVLAGAKDANALTPWTSGGRQWTVVLRPLLPDEAGCADLRE
jgi:hypothetical protein